MLRKRNQHELLIPAVLLFLTDSDQGDEDNNQVVASWGQSLDSGIKSNTKGQ